MGCLLCCAQVITFNLLKKNSVTFVLNKNIKMYYESIHVYFRAYVLYFQREWEIICDDVRADHRVVNIYFRHMMYEHMMQQDIR